jgi:uncharacterized membrane protein
MNAEEQSRAHGHHGHSHALPSFRRIAVKTVTYGVMHFVVAVTVAFAITQNWRIALTVGVIEPLVQMVFFAVHDRIWAVREARRALQAA